MATSAEAVWNPPRPTGVADEKWATVIDGDPASLPVRVGDVANEPDFATWRAASVDALVMGSVERGGEVSSQVRVWDTQAAAQVELFTGTYLPEGELRAFLAGTAVGIP